MFVQLPAFRRMENSDRLRLLQRATTEEIRMPRAPAEAPVPANVLA